MQSPSLSVPGWATADELRQWDREHYWHAFTQMAEYEPFVIQRAEGVHLFDLDGRAYLDAVSSLWCNVHGHGHPHINRAITEQLQQVAHVTSLGMSNPTTIRLSRALAMSTRQLGGMAPRVAQTADELPDGSVESSKELTRVFYSSDGACAVEVALKLAFQYWRQCPRPEPQRTLFMAVGNAYHGDTLGGVSVGGVSRFHAMFDPLLFDVVRGPCPDTYRLPDGVTAESACEYYLHEYATLLKRFGERVAAVIVEPLVQGAAGMIMHPPGFLAGLQRLTAQYGILFIADEVAVGMGRTGTMWSCQKENVRPDFLCLGKGLSGGYLPLSATITTSEVWNAFLGRYEESRSFFHGHTYGGNPLAAAAALATLELFDLEHTLSKVARRSELLRELLRPIEPLPHVGNVRQQGLIAAIELVRDKRTAEPFPWSERRAHAVCQTALQHGVWLRPLGNVIIIMPPLCITDAQLEQIVTTISRAMDSVQL